MSFRSRYMVHAAALSALLLASACSTAESVPSPDEAPGQGTPSSAPASPGSGSPDPVQSAPVATSPKPDQSGTCPSDPCTTVVVTGDLLLHEGLWDQAVADGKDGLDFGPMLSGQKEFVEPADLAICHQETPLANPDGPFSGFPAFNVPPQIIETVADLGYDACTTASNHTLDAGTDGVDRTLDALDGAGLEHTGSYRAPVDADEPFIVDTGEAKIAVITGTYALNGLTPAFPEQVDLLDLSAMIAKGRLAREAGADVVLAAVHAGDEYADYANEQQQQVAHALVDSSEFDLVYGHHSHSVLPIEKYRGVWIVYGLGNTIAAHLTPDIRNTEGLLVEVSFEQHDGGWRDAGLRWLPVTWNGAGHRWCPVAAYRLAEMAAENAACVSTAADAASRERTKVTVESLGADGAGAVEWQGE